MNIKIEKHADAFRLDISSEGTASVCTCNSVEEILATIKKHIEEDTNLEVL